MNELEQLIQRVESLLLGLISVAERTDKAVEDALDVQGEQGALSSELKESARALEAFTKALTYAASKRNDSGFNRLAEGVQNINKLLKSVDTRKMSSLQKALEAQAQLMLQISNMAESQRRVTESMVSAIVSTVRETTKLMGQFKGMNEEVITLARNVREAVNEFDFARASTQIERIRSNIENLNLEKYDALIRKLETIEQRMRDIDAVRNITASAQTSDDDDAKPARATRRAQSTQDAVNLPKLDLDRVKKQIKDELGGLGDQIVRSLEAALTNDPERFKKAVEGSLLNMHTQLRTELGKTIKDSAELEKKLLDIYSQLNPEDVVTDLAKSLNAGDKGGIKNLIERYGKDLVATVAEALKKELATDYYGEIVKTVGKRKRGAPTKRVDASTEARQAMESDLEIGAQLEKAHTKLQALRARSEELAQQRKKYLEVVEAELATNEKLRRQTMRAYLTSAKPAIGVAATDEAGKKRVVEAAARTSIGKIESGDQVEDSVKRFVNAFDTVTQRIKTAFELDDVDAGRAELARIFDTYFKKTDANPDGITAAEFKKLVGFIAQNKFGKADDKLAGSSMDLQSNAKSQVQLEREVAKLTQQVRSGAGSTSTSSESSTPPRQTFNRLVDLSNSVSPNMSFFEAISAKLKRAFTGFIPLDQIAASVAEFIDSISKIPENLLSSTGKIEAIQGKLKEAVGSISASYLDAAEDMRRALDSLQESFANLRTLLNFAADVTKDQPLGPVGNYKPELFWEILDNMFGENKDHITHKKTEPIEENKVNRTSDGVIYTYTPDSDTISSSEKQKLTQEAIKQAVDESPEGVAYLSTYGSPHTGSTYADVDQGLEARLDHAVLAFRDALSGSIRILEMSPGAVLHDRNSTPSAMMGSKAVGIKDVESLKPQTGVVAVPLKITKAEAMSLLAETALTQTPGAVYSLASEIGETCSSSIAVGIRKAGLDEDLGKPIKGINVVTPGHLLEFFRTLTVSGDNEAEQEKPDPQKGAYYEAKLADLERDFVGSFKKDHGETASVAAYVAHVKGTTKNAHAAQSMQAVYGSGTDVYNVRAYDNTRTALQYGEAYHKGYADILSSDGLEGNDLYKKILAKVISSFDNQDGSELSKALGRLVEKTGQVKNISDISSVGNSFLDELESVNKGLADSLSPIFGDFIAASKVYDDYEIRKAAIKTLDSGAAFRADPTTSFRPQQTQQTFNRLGANIAGEDKEKATSNLLGTVGSRLKNLLTGFAPLDKVAQSVAVYIENIKKIPNSIMDSSTKLEMVADKIRSSLSSLSGSYSGMSTQFREAVNTLKDTLSSIRDLLKFVHGLTKDYDFKNLNDAGYKKYAEIAKYAMSHGKPDEVFKADSSKVVSNEVRTASDGVVYVHAPDMEGEDRSKLVQQAIEQAVDSSPAGVAYLTTYGEPHVGSAYGNVDDGLDVRMDHALLAFRDALTGAIRILELTPKDEPLPDNPTNEPMLGSYAAGVKRLEEMAPEAGIVATPLKINKQEAINLLAETALKQTPGATYSLANAIGETCSSSIAAGVRAAGLDDKIGRPVKGSNALTPAELGSFFRTLDTSTKESMTEKPSAEKADYYAQALAKLELTFAESFRETHGGDLDLEDSIAQLKGLAPIPEEAKSKLKESYGKRGDAQEVQAFDSTRTALQYAVAYHKGYEGIVSSESKQGPDLLRSILLDSLGSFKLMGQSSLADLEQDISGVQDSEGLSKVNDKFLASLRDVNEDAAAVMAPILKVLAESYTRKDDYGVRKAAIAALDVSETLSVDPRTSAENLPGNNFTRLTNDSLGQGARSFETQAPGLGLFAGITQKLKEGWRSLLVVPESVTTFSEKIAMAAKQAEASLEQATRLITSESFGSFVKFSNMVHDAVRSLVQVGADAYSASVSFASNLGSAKDILDKLAASMRSFLGYEPLPPPKPYVGDPNDPFREIPREASWADKTGVSNLLKPLYDLANVVDDLRDRLQRLINDLYFATGLNDVVAGIRLFSKVVDEAEPVVKRLVAALELLEAGVREMDTDMLRGAQAVFVEIAKFAKGMGKSVVETGKQSEVPVLREVAEALGAAFSTDTLVNRGSRRAYNAVVNAKDGDELADGIYKLRESINNSALITLDSKKAFNEVAKLLIRSYRAGNLDEVRQYAQSMSAVMFTASTTSYADRPPVIVSTEPTGEVASEPPAESSSTTVNPEGAAVFNALRSGMPVLDAISNGYAIMNFFGSQGGAILNGLKEFAFAMRELNPGTLVDMAGAVLKIMGASQNILDKTVGWGRRDRNANLFEGGDRKDRRDTITTILRNIALRYEKFTGANTGQDSVGTISAEELNARKIAAAAAVQEFSRSRFNGTNPQREAAKVYTASSLVNSGSINEQSIQFQQFWKKIKPEQRVNLGAIARKIEQFYADILKTQGYSYNAPGKPKPKEDPVQNAQKAGEQARKSTINSLIGSDLVLPDSTEAQTNAYRKFIQNLTEDELIRIKAMEANLLKLAEGTGLADVVKRQGYAVVTASTLENIVADVFGKESDAYKEFSAIRGSEGKTTVAGLSFALPDSLDEAGNQRRVALSVIGNQRTDVSAGEAALHELTHNITNELQDQTKSLFSSFDAQSRKDFLASSEEAKRAIQEGAAALGDSARQFVNSVFSGDNLSYYFSPEEVLANVGQAILSGNRNLTETLKLVYGEELFNSVDTALTNAAPDVYGAVAREITQTRFADFDSAAKEITSASSSEASGGVDSDGFYAEESANAAKTSYDALERSFTQLVDKMLNRPQEVIDSFSDMLNKAKRQVLKAQEATLSPVDDMAASVMSVGNKALSTYTEGGGFQERVMVSVLRDPAIATALSEFLRDSTVDSFKTLADSSLSTVKENARVALLGTKSRLPKNEVIRRPFYNEAATELGRKLSTRTLEDNYFEDFRKQFRKQSGEELKRDGFTMTEQYDFETGTTKLTASAKTASGAMTQLTASIDALGNINMDGVRGIGKTLDDARDRLVRELPQELSEEAIQFVVMAIQQLFSSVLEMQDEIAQVEILMEASMGDLGSSVVQSANRFVAAAITAADLTGQGFQESLQTYIQNFKLAGALKDPEDRTQLAQRMANVQLGSQTVFDLSLDESLSSLPAIYAQVKDTVRDSSGFEGASEAEIANESASRVELLMDQFIVAQRASGANAKDLIQVYASMASSAKDLRMDPQKLMSLAAVSSVKLAKSPEETSNALKFFIERLYSNTTSDRLAKYGIATKEVTSEGEIRYRGLQDIIADINTVTESNTTAAKAITQLIGGRARAGEASAIIASGDEALRVEDYVKDNTVGNEFEKELDRKREKFTGSLNTMQANLGQFINVTLFSSGLLNDLGSSLATVTGHIATLSLKLQESGEKLGWMRPLIAALGESLLYRFVNMGKSVVGLLGPLTKLGLVVRNTLTVAENNLMQGGSVGSQRIAQSALAAINEFNRLQAAGKLTEESMQAVAAQINKAFATVGVQVRTLAGEMAALGTTAGKTAAGAVTNQGGQPVSTRPFIDPTNTSGAQVVANPARAAVNPRAKLNGIEARDYEFAAELNRTQNGYYQDQHQRSTRFTTKDVDAYDSLNTINALKGVERAAEAVDHAERERELATKASSTAEKAATIEKVTSTQKLNFFGGGLDKARRFLEGFTGTRSVTGVSPLLTGASGVGIRKAGSTLGDLALPIAMDAMIGGFNAENIVNIGAGIAGGFAGSLTGTPMGTLVGYTVAQGFSEYIDLYGTFSEKVSTSQRESLKSTYATVLQREQEYEGLSEEERLKKDRERELKEKERTDRARAMVLSGLGLASRPEEGFTADAVKNLKIEIPDYLQNTNSRRFTLNPENTIRKLKQAASADDANREILRTGDLREEIALVEELERSNPALLEFIVNADKLNNNITLDKFLSGIMDSPELLEAASVLAESLGDNLEDLGGSGDVATAHLGSLEQTLKKVNELLGTTGEKFRTSFTDPTQSSLMQLGDFGTVNTDLREDFAPKFEAIASGEISGEDADVVTRQYEMAKERLSGMGALEIKLTPLSEELDQDLLSIREDLYAIGPEGQNAFDAMITPLLEMITYTKEYEALLQAIALIKNSPEYQAGEGGDDFAALEAELVNLEKQVGSRSALYQVYTQYLGAVKSSPDTLQNELNMLKSQEKVRQKATVIKGTPAQFRMPTMVDVEGNSVEDIQAALEEARSKQADITSMFPQMAEEFRREQFMMESGGDYAAVTGVSQSYFQDALNNRKRNKPAKLEAPNTVDMREYDDATVEKILADARTMQDRAVALAPDLAEEYEDDRLLLMREGNDIALETGLSQEYLRAAIEANTASTEDNTEGLRGHYNLPGNYRAPTIWDYYDQGGTEAGTNNFVAPPGSAPGDMVSMDMAQNIANAILNQGSGSTDSEIIPDLGGLGGLIDPNAAKLGYPDPGTPDKIIMPPELSLPDGIDTTELNVAEPFWDLPDGPEGESLQTALDDWRKGEREAAPPPEEEKGFVAEVGTQLIDFFKDIFKELGIVVGETADPAKELQDATLLTRDTFNELMNAGNNTRTSVENLDTALQPTSGAIDALAGSATTSADFMSQASSLFATNAGTASATMTTNTGTFADTVSLSTGSMNSSVIDFATTVGKLATQLTTLNLADIIAKAINSGNVKITVEGAGNTRAEPGTGGAGVGVGSGRGSPALSGGPNSGQRAQ